MWSRIKSTAKKAAKAVKSVSKKIVNTAKKVVKTVVKRQYWINHLLIKRY